ncbi:MAG: type VII toxin-antitoxin system MntA family adenylyltransferase antitoxin [Vibrio sp.]
MELKDIDNDVILKSIIKYASTNLDIEVMWLYGSRATGASQAHSDYDLAIAFKDFSLSDFEKRIRPNQLALELSSSLGIPSEKLSIVDINQVPIYLSYSIVEHGKIIYQLPSSRAHKEFVRISAIFEHQKRDLSNER